MEVRKEVFFSYSHKDETLRDELEKRLIMMKRRGLFNDWHDRKIGPGKEWTHEIDIHLNTAEIILLLISPDFLASDYCYSVEVKKALNRHETGEARVIPIILRPVDWEDTPFEKLQVLPTDAKPVTSWSNLDEAFLDIAKGIRKAVEELRAKPLLSSTSSISAVSVDLHKQSPPFPVPSLDREHPDGVSKSLNLGTLHSVKSKVEQLNQQEQNTDEKTLALADLITCSRPENVLFKAAGAAKGHASLAIQSLILRLLTKHAPGKVRFIFIDPIGLGQNFAAFLELADYDESLITNRAWTEQRLIEQRLVDLSEHMETIIQKYLRNQFSTIEEYNQQAGEVAEPYRILVVMDFPVNFTEDTTHRLVSIATNGPRCGVSTIVMLDTEQRWPYFSIADLERVSTVITWNHRHFVWQDKDFKNVQLNLGIPPQVDIFNSTLKEVAELAKTAKEVRVPFARICPAIDQWWTGNTREGIKIPLGRVGATKLQLLDLGKGTSQHVLLVGKTGSGKTTLLHVLIANLALTYSPDELELYLVDFKTVGFTPYATYRLPHARVVATQSEREFGLSVLQGLDAELERRKNTFSKTGVQDIAQYRNAQPNARMPRILLLVDEFQEFFTEEDKVAQQAGLSLDRLVRQGRAFGIHVMLGSQTLAGTYTLARSTIGQMAVRVALQCEEADSRLVLSDDNPAARLLSRPGEAIYNSANGLVEGNNPFQCCWLPDDELDVYLGRIQQFAQQRRYVPSWRQIVFDGSKNADVVENSLLNDALRAPTWVTAQKSIRAWLGDPIAIKEPTAVQIRAQAGNNLLIIGQQEEVALGMLVTALLSLTTQHAPGTARFYIVDFSPVDASYAGLLEHVGQMLPHGVKVINRRGLVSAVTEIGDEVDIRMEKVDGRLPPIYLLIHGLQRARELRSDEDFSFSSFGSGTLNAPSPAKRFSTILREGPELDVHTLAWCDTLTNLNRTLERGTLREFEMRAAFQMSSDDSMNLVDSSDASKLGSYRALLFSEETGRAEKFRPYDLPSEEWLQKAVTFIRQKR